MVAFMAKKKNFTEVSPHNELSNMVLTWCVFFASSEQQLWKSTIDMETNESEGPPMLDPDSVERAPTRTRLQISAWYWCEMDEVDFCRWWVSTFTAFISFNYFTAFISFISFTYFNSFTVLLFVFHRFFAWSSKVHSISRYYLLRLCSKILRLCIYGYAIRFCCWLLLSSENDNTTGEEKRWEATSNR